MFWRWPMVRSATSSWQERNACATAPAFTISSKFARHECGKEAAENTANSYRKLSLYPLGEEGLVVRHQLSTNDPKTFYRLHPEMLRLLTCPAPLELCAGWRGIWLSGHHRGKNWKQQRRRAEIPVEVGQPKLHFLSPGTHSWSHRSSRGGRRPPCSRKPLAPWST